MPAARIGRKWDDGHVTTPRNDDFLRADDATRVDLPIAADEPSGTGASESRPPAFPSVGGAPKGHDHVHTEVPFAHVRDESLAASPVVDTSRPVLAAPVGARTSRWRWVAAAVATLVVVALVAGIVFFGARQATPSLVAQFAPADAAAYAELRLDLPGDQRDRLVSFFGHFPGFADPASFQQKIDETLSNALRRSGTGLDWAADVDPWFGGQIGFFTSSLAPSYGVPPSFSVVLSVKDRARLDEMVAARTAESGMQQEDYNGQTIWSGNATAANQRISFAVTGEALVISARNEDLKAALDVKAGEVAGLADDAFFTGQLAHMHADRLALFYYDYSSLIKSMPPAVSLVPAGCLDDLQAAADIRLLGELRAEADHIAANIRSQYPTAGNLPPAPANRRTALAESMPAGTLAYVEMRQIDAGIKYLVDELLSCMNGTAPGGIDLSLIEQFIGTTPQDYFDFLDDAAFAVTLNDGKVGGGLVATVDDENVARARVERLLAAVRLAGGLGGGLTIEEEQHGNAAITVIRFAAAGLPVGEAPSMSITVSGGRMYLGLDDFVTAALDRTAADSLAAAPRLQQALSGAGAENAGIVYVDIAAMRGFLESMMPVGARADYDTEAKPFLEPITHLIVISRNDGGINVGHGFLYVE